MKEGIEEFDERGNVIHYKGPNGFEYWSTFDKDDREVSCKNSEGASEQWGYGEDGRLIYYKSISERKGLYNEHWYKYADNGEQIEITQQEFEQIKAEKEQKEFLSREEISRFEIMEL